MTSDTETSPDEHSGERPARPQVALVWIYPSEHVTLLSDGLISMGRDAECGVQLVGPSVSRRHASIRCSGSLHVLHDEGSRNGTWRNAARVTRAPLECGDVVRIGSWIAVVVCITKPDAFESKSERGEYVLSAGVDEPRAGVVIGPSMRAEWRKLARVAQSKLPVVLIGPTGSGKEVFARALHELSGRNGKLIAVNCAALPEALIEAQLFGYARGAYTGAQHASPGLFFEAHGGTLFLDEVLDLPATQQAKVLRVIGEGVVTAVGAIDARPIDVRLVVASQRPLAEEVKCGRFRADLYARLSGASLRLAPLRERREEIPRLFLRFFTESGGQPQKLRASLIERLCLYEWPLNIRQLKQAAQRAAIVLAKHPSLGASSFDAILDRMPGANNRREDCGRSAESAGETKTARDVLGVRRWAWLGRHRDELCALREAMARQRGNVSAAAREIGMSRARAQRLLAAARIGSEDS